MASFSIPVFGQSATVTQAVANLYSSPSESADVVTQAIYGTSVGVLEQSLGWARIRTPDDYTGWVRQEGLRPLASDERHYASAGTVVHVESLFANLYREPNVTKHQPVLTIPFDSPLEVLAQPENDGRRWIEVRLADGATAWVQRGDVTFDLSPRSLKAVLDLSQRFLGLPYFWGGTSSFGFDCSGFVQMLYRKRGIFIPRDTGPQFRWDGFVAVRRNKLKPGDLIYFGKPPDKVSHVGMYLGRGKFINATTHERPLVQIGKLKDPYWTKIFVGARRPK